MEKKKLIINKVNNNYNMERALSNRKRKEKNIFKSYNIKTITNKNIINEKNIIKTNIKPISASNSNKNIINFDENIKKSTLKLKNPEILNQRIHKNKSTQKIKNAFDFSKFDMQKMEYSIDKNLSRPQDFHARPFLSRMEMDIKKRQTKDEKRKALLEDLKPKTKEEYRIKCFNRLISDVNKRNKIKENIENQNEFFSTGISPKRIGKKQWDAIYEERFYKYQEQLDDNLREKIIENEKMILKKEEDIIEQINLNTRKMKKQEIDKITNRLYLNLKKKEINKKLDDIIATDKNKDKANGMKKEEDPKNITNITNNNDNSNSIRGKKQHSTIKSLKIREKKNSYFGSVIIKTSTFEPGKAHSLIKYIQNIKSGKNTEKRLTFQADKEILENENENLNMSILNKSIDKNNNINKNKNRNKKKSHVNFENLESTSDIWANDTRIKKSQSLKRILVNDFNINNMKFNINTNICKNKKKKVEKGNIINLDYYKNIDEVNDNSEDINLNDFEINDLRHNIKRSKNLNQYKIFNSAIAKRKSNIKNIYIFDNKKNKNKKERFFSDKKAKSTKKKFINELSAMKIVEDCFVNKIKNNK